MNVTKRTSIVCVTGIDDGNESAMEVTELHVASPLSNDAMLLSAAEAKLAHMTKEREIFLRAALQLLDKREHNVPQKKKYKNPFKITRVKSLKSGTANTEDTMMDVIRFGSLRKANRYHRGIIEVEKWKRKFIELRHGMFSYENENIKWLRGVKKKVMLLSAHTCKCRVFQLDGPEGSKVFELTVHGGPRRLWLADSAEERDAWVKAINTAMSGSAGDSGAQGLVDPSARSGGGQPKFDPNHPLSSCMACALKNVHEYCAGLGINSRYIANLDSSDGAGNALGAPSGQSFEGAAAPYASDISRYTSIQSAIQCAMTLDQCRDITCAIVGSLADTSMVIPVQFVKRQMNCENFAMSTQDSLTAKTLQSVTSSQVWKDLQRDSIRINNVLISGENEGPEAMIGCLVRTILDKAELIRRISKDYHEHLAVRKQRQQAASSAALLANNARAADPSGIGKGGADDERERDGDGDTHQSMRKQRSISFPGVESESDYEESVLSSGENPTLGAALGSPGKINFLMPAQMLKESFSAVVDTVIENISNSGRGSHGGTPPPPAAADSAPVFVPVKPPAYLSSFEITEGQVLACARDLLVLCNRTQSGGDTYFCIDQMLCNHEHCILTPVASEKESPLEITVDIVEGQAKGAGRHSVKSTLPTEMQDGMTDGDVLGAAAAAATASVGGASGAGGGNRSPRGGETQAESFRRRRESESSKASSSDTGDLGSGAAAAASSSSSSAAIPARRPLSTGSSSAASVTAEAVAGPVPPVTVGGPGGLVASRLPGGPVPSGSNRQASIYSTASSTDRVGGSTGGHYIHSATTSVSGEDNSSSASFNFNERHGRDTASVVSTASDRMLIPLTAKSLQQLQHRPGVTTSLPPAVDISSVKPGASTHSAGALVSAGSGNDLAAAGGRDSESALAASGPPAGGRGSLSRTNSDVQSQCSRTSNVSLHSVHSASAGAVTTSHEDGGTNASLSRVTGTPGTTPAAFIVEDEDCMSPFLRKPQFPYAVPRATTGPSATAPASAHRAQLSLPASAARSAPTSVGEKLHQHRHSADDSSSSSSENEEKEDEEESHNPDPKSIRRPISLPRRGATPVGGSRGIAGAGAGTPLSHSHSREDSCGSEHSHASLTASVIAHIDPHESATPPSNAELEEAAGQMSNYVGGSMCIRVQVRAVSKYRLCTLDPQDEDTDTWATVTGEFEQCFFIKSNCNGRPAISDRLVKLSIDDPSCAYPGGSHVSTGETNVPGLELTRTALSVGRISTFTPRAEEATAAGTAAQMQHTQTVPSRNPTPPPLPRKPSIISGDAPMSALPPAPVELTVRS